jgi:hypothetical protein
MSSTATLLNIFGSAAPEYALLTVNAPPEVP